MRTPIEQLEQFLANPHNNADAHHLQLSIYLARLMRWMEFSVLRQEQRDLFLLDFPQDEEPVRALERRLALLREELRNAVYTALGNTEDEDNEGLFSRAGLLLERCACWADEVRALLQGGYELDLEVAHLDSSARQEAVTRIGSPRL